MQILAEIVENVREAVIAFVPGDELASIGAWIGTADRLALIHPSGPFDAICAAWPERGKVDAGRARGPEFVTLTGHRPASLASRAEAYARATRATLRDGAHPEAAFVAARDLRSHALDLLERLPEKERVWRLQVAIGGWTYYDEEPAAA